MNQNRLHPDNCNKAKCKSCIFGPTPLQLTPERKDEIITYLVKLESSHICHTTDKTCYGAMELQAQTMHRMGIIKEPTVECFLETAKQFVNK